MRRTSVSVADVRGLRSSGFSGVWKGTCYLHGEYVQLYSFGLFCALFLYTLYFVLYIAPLHRERVQLTDFFQS